MMSYSVMCWVKRVESKWFQGVANDRAGKELQKVINRNKETKDKRQS